MSSSGLHWWDVIGFARYWQRNLHTLRIGYYLHCARFGWPRLSAWTILLQRSLSSSIQFFAAWKSSALWEIFEFVSIVSSFLWMSEIPSSLANSDSSRWWGDHLCFRVKATLIDRDHEVALKINCNSSKTHFAFKLSLACLAMWQGRHFRILSCTILSVTKNRIFLCSRQCRLHDWMAQCPT